MLLLNVILFLFLSTLFLPFECKLMYSLVVVMLSLSMTWTVMSPGNRNGKIMITICREIPILVHLLFIFFEFICVYPIVLLF